MADLIDRAALGIGKANPNVFEKPEYADGWNSAIDILQKAPTVDVVEVVRCRECEIPHNKYTGCPKLNGLVTPPDFYCSYGEKKDNEVL